MNGVITLNEACEILSISTATGRNWIKSGLLVPVESDNRDMYFLSSDINKIKEDIKANKIDRLNKRRNKSSVNGSFIPRKYINDVRGLKLVEDIITETANIVTEKTLRIILAEYALKFYEIQKTNNQNQIFIKNLKNNKDIVYQLTKQFLDSQGIDDEAIDEYLEFENNGLHYNVFELTEDVLGLLYMSLNKTANRKKDGIYYTPTNVVKTMVKKIIDLKVNISSTIDPCCGTGNFLLELAKNNFPITSLYGHDIDSTSIYIARINLIIFSEATEAEVFSIIQNITVKDSLKLIEESDSYDLVIGNPPWGSEFDENTLNYVAERFETYSKRGLEAFSLFIELGSKITSSKGLFSYIVPETFFNVKTHEPIRKLIMSMMNIKDVYYWGNVFDGVLAPALSFVFINEKSNEFGFKAKITDYSGKEHVIEEKRVMSHENWDFLINDHEMKLLDKIEKLDSIVYLMNNAEFALGIVTGNNKEHLVKEQINDNYSSIVRGSDIYKFSIEKPSNYINYQPEKYQQVAKNNLYFENEKLIYRFISDTLVFAYDNQKTLSLNSANILVPKIKGLNIKYIAAILNSKIAHFYFKLKFNSIKILRNHIESIPIRIPDKGKQQQIIELVDKIILSKEEAEIMQIYEDLNKVIYEIYTLDSNEVEYVDSFNKGNIFLLK